MKSWSVGLTGLLGLVAILAVSYADSGLEVAVGIVIAALFGFGWPHYLAIPARKTLGLVISIAGALSAIAANFSNGPSYLLWLAPIIAVGVGAIFAVQLIRGTGQSHRLESTFGGVVGVLISAVGSGWIAAHRFTGDGALTLITGASAVVVLLLGMIRWPDRIIAPLGLVLGALAGPLVAIAFSDLHILPAAVIGVVVAAILLSFRRLNSIVPALHSIPGGIAMGLAPVLSLGGVVYFIDKMLIF
ncbi:permease [Psychromicrobium sp. YIM B11713]|uniref:permease n=1 Tax=Psychromicrobium sp. YIM B11713 TaxID=3145233 RepID=UPI00374F5BC2